MSDPRKVRYQLLREAGFTSYEANRLKDYSLEKIEYFIDMNKKYKEWLKHEVNAKGKKHGNHTK